MSIQVDLVPSPLKTKKWRMVFLRLKDGAMAHTDFGQKNPPMSDYTQHKDEHRKAMFLNRFKKKIEQSKDDPASAMTLSTMILWGEPTIDKSLKKYKKFFGFK